MKIKISLHQFASDRALPQCDGVNLAHSEINRLLALPEGRHFHVEFHDFDRLMRDDDHARSVLHGVDCVLCNVGPHAHYYYYLRERLGLDFRIIRDIKTALWSCYLLQESLCAPYLRPGDALLAPSEYSRLLTRQIFPHLLDHTVSVFEPVLTAEPAADTKFTAQRAPAGKIVTLGYVGRLSEDKNFPQVVDLLIKMNRLERGRYRLVACGAVHSATCAPARIEEHIRRQTGLSDLFTYIPPRPYREVLKLYRSFDYFLFFSTSNVETLGRVIVEAASAGTPILAANHAAVPELLDPTSAIDVHYFTDHIFHTHFDHPLGEVDIEAAANMIRNRFQPAPPPPVLVNRASVLMALLTSGDISLQDRLEHGLDHGSIPFMRRLHLKGISIHESPSTANSMVATLRTWFCGLNGKKSPVFKQTLAALKHHSRFPERTEKFVRSTETTRADFSNLGGMDMELCNIANFHPLFWISNQTEAERAPTVDQFRVIAC